MVVDWSSNLRIINGRVEDQIIGKWEEWVRLRARIKFALGVMSLVGLAARHLARSDSNLLVHLACWPVRSVGLFGIQPGWTCKVSWRHFGDPSSANQLVQILVVEAGIVIQIQPRSVPSQSHSMSLFAKYRISKTRSGVFSTNTPPTIKSVLGFDPIGLVRLILKCSVYGSMPGGPFYK